MLVFYWIPMKKLSLAKKIWKDERKLKSWVKIEDVRFTPFIYALFIRIHHNLTIVYVQLTMRVQNKKNEYNAGQVVRNILS